MRTRRTRFAVGLSVLAAALLTTVAAGADEIAVGDPAEKVRAVLGEPRGHIRSGTYELLQYDRGRVELRDGVVTQVELVTAEEAEMLKAQREEQFRAAEERQAALREQRRLEGIDTRDRALANPEFLASSGARQIEFWDGFRARYPDVPIAAEYTVSLAKRDQERTEAETQQRLAAMEARVQEAEARAQEAKAEADSRRYVYVGSPYVYRYGYGASRPPHHHNHPPTPIKPAPWQPTYPSSSWSHNYTSWGSPHYVVQPSSISMPPSSICMPPSSIQSSGLRVNVNF